MVSIRRGDVFLINFDPTVGAEVKKSHPAVVAKMYLTSIFIKHIINT